MSEIANLMPPPDADLRAARRQFVELYGTPLVATNYLRIALACVSLVCLGLLVLNVKTFQPLVIRINDVGRAEAVDYDSLTYQPHDAEVRYFLIEFVTKHYCRMRATLRENFARSLYFLDGRLADAIIEANKKNRVIEDFLTSDAPQIDVVVKNVSIEDMRMVWKQDGEEGLRAELALLVAPIAPQIDLTSSVLEYDYDLFGTLHAAS
jgi:type IV secretory pathway TrbF-like protein